MERDNSYIDHQKIRVQAEAHVETDNKILIRNIIARYAGDQQIGDLLKIAVEMDFEKLNAVLWLLSVSR